MTLRPASRSALASIVLCLLAGCGGSNAAATADAGAAADDAGGTIPSSDAATTDAATSDTGATDAGSGAFDAGGYGGPASLPIGDGKYAPAPQRGYVYTCQRSFSGGGGAQADGPWIDEDAGTFAPLAKIAVQGAVSWPAHSFAATLSGSTRSITGNGLPDHPTGVFPIASTDPAYAYDHNPNSIKAQSIAWSLPANPTVATTPSCVSGGPIGILVTGAVFFDALDAEGRDAVAHEAQDACEAHPEMSGEYHYHSLTTCVADPGTGHSALMGYALDGFGIYGPRGENGAVLTDADLDECHGHTHVIDWDGAQVAMYHYHATYEFPYTVGCFKGTPITIPHGP